MKPFSKLTILGILIFSSIVSQAQIQKSIGINWVPLIAKTLEINGEVKPKQWFAINASTGYTFNTSYIGLIDYKVYDFTKDRKTSGWFLKSSFLFYPTGLKGKESKTSFFMGLGLALSDYNQSAIYMPQDEPERRLTRTGTILSPLASLGFTSKISNHFYLNWGVQRPFYIHRDDFIGTRRRNYQPGLGNPQSDPFVGYLQGILTLKYTW